MGIYIPNMDKPKSCWECRLMDGEANCLVTDEGIPFKQEGILPYCPLIEIVRCGECKYAKYKIEDAEYVKCMITQLFVSKSDFCSYGERKGE